MARTLVPIEAAFVNHLLMDVSEDEIDAFKRFIAKINRNALQYL